MPEPRRCGMSYTAKLPTGTSRIRCGRRLFEVHTATAVFYWCQHCDRPPAEPKTNDYGPDLEPPTEDEATEADP